MKSAHQILKDLGFNKNAPESTKKAFLKNLKNSADELEVARKIKEFEKEEPNKQLDFFADLNRIHDLSREKVNNYKKKR